MDLKQHVRDVPDFPRAGILFRDIAPLLRHHFEAVADALSALLTGSQWGQVDAIAGIESRGFILAAALALRHGKGFVPIRKQGKLPPPVVCAPYALEYGAGVLEMQPGAGRLVIVDDVLATGGTLAASANLAAEAGYTVTELLVLIDLRLATDFRWRELSVRSALCY